MPWQAKDKDKDIVAVRREMLDLLRQQIESLDSPGGLTDTQLIECYNRQGRVQELREKLQALLAEQETFSVPHQVSDMPLAA
jgi:hypothetical protein